MTALRFSGYVALMLVVTTVAVTARAAMEQVVANFPVHAYEKQ